jgi:hypothetical protein
MAEARDRGRITSCRHAGEQAGVMREGVSTIQQHGSQSCTVNTLLAAAELCPAPEATWD